MASPWRWKNSCYVFFLFSNSHPFEQQCVTSIDGMQLEVEYETSQAINMSCPNLLDYSWAPEILTEELQLHLDSFAHEAECELGSLAACQDCPVKCQSCGEAAIWKEHYAHKSTVRNNTSKQQRPVEIGNKKPNEAYVRLALTFWHANGNGNWESNCCVCRVLPCLQRWSVASCIVA